MLDAWGDQGMNEADLNVAFGYICSLIGAGTPLASSEPDTGGLLYRMWRESVPGAFTTAVLRGTHTRILLHVGMSCGLHKSRFAIIAQFVIKLIAIHEYEVGSTIRFIP